MKITQTIKPNEIQTLADAPNGKIFLTRSPLDSRPYLRFRDGNKVYILYEAILAVSTRSPEECVVKGVATEVSIEIDTTEYDG
jgi:hypothetical protein